MKGTIDNLLTTFQQRGIVLGVMGILLAAVLALSGVVVYMDRRDTKQQQEYADERARLYDRIVQCEQTAAQQIQAILIEQSRIEKQMRDVLKKKKR